MVKSVVEASSMMVLLTVRRVSWASGSDMILSIKNDTKYYEDDKYITLPFRSAAGDVLPGVEGDSHLQFQDIPLLLGILGGKTFF